MADNKADGLKCYTRLTHGKYPWEPQDAPPPLEPRTAEPARNATEKDEIKVKNDKYANLEGWTRQNVRSVMESNMDLNYVTGGSGLKFGGDQTPNNMLYEGQLFENFSLLRASSTAKGNIFNTDFWLDAPVRIQLRQLTSVWKPVYTPSYNPGLRLMAAPTADFQPNNMLAYYSLGVFHYSNGQGPPPGGPDPGPLDTTTQKFNTNYVEAAAHLVKGGKSVDNDVNDFPWARLAVRQQFYGTWVPQMAGQYPKRSVSLELRTPEMAFGCGALSPASSSGQAPEHGHRLTQGSDWLPPTTAVTTTSSSTGGAKALKDRPGAFLGQAEHHRRSCCSGLPPSSNSRYGSISAMTTDTTITPSMSSTGSTGCSLAWPQSRFEPANSSGGAFVASCQGKMTLEKGKRGRVQWRYLS